MGLKLITDSKDNGEGGEGGGGGICVCLNTDGLFDDGSKGRAPLTRQKSKVGGGEGGQRVTCIWLLCTHSSAQISIFRPSSLTCHSH